MNFSDPKGYKYHVGDGWRLYHGDCLDVVRNWGTDFVQLMLFSTPYPGLLGFKVDAQDYLWHWLPKRLGALLPLMRETGVIMQNIWFPRTADGWYDIRVFDIPRIYESLGWHLIDPHPWDKINAPPSGRHKRHDRDEYEFCFTFAQSRDYIYHPYRRPYQKKTVDKAASGNMRQPDINGQLAGGHARLNQDGAAQGSIFRFSPTGGREVYRPRIEDRVFPMALAERAIMQHSDPGNVVLDPWVGSGTSMVMAVEHRRFGLGIDKKVENLATTREWLELEHSKREKDHG